MAMWFETLISPHDQICNNCLREIPKGKLVVWDGESNPLCAMCGIDTMSTVSEEIAEATRLAFDEASHLEMFDGYD